MTINTTCTITNKSGKSVVIINAFNSSTNVATNSTKQGYLQDLKRLPLSSGGYVLANGATATVTLNETYVDLKGKTRTSYIYDLMVSQADSLFPVMVIGESLDFHSMSYPAITVTSAAAGKMAKALSFCQNIMTSPSSNMATAFRTAMTDAFKLSSVAAIEQAIADFFNKYPIFAGLDFPSYVAVSTWLRGFAYPWGMDGKGHPGQTYYVYSAPSQGKKGAESEGTIVFAPKAHRPSPADPTDRQSGMSITLIGSSGSQTALSFVNGQLIDGGSGAVALNCSFGFAGTFTGKETDTTAWPIMVGTMLNKPVLVIPLPAQSAWSKFWTTLTFHEVVNYFLTVMGVWMALDFLKQQLFGKDKALEDKKANDNEGEDPDSSQEEESSQSGEDVGKAAAQENQQLADNVAPDGAVKVPVDDAAFDQAVGNARGQAANAYKSVAEDNLGGGIESANAQLSELAQIEVVPAMNDAMNNLVDAQNSLSSGDLKGASSNLGEVNKAVPEIVNQMGDKVGSELKAEIQADLEVQSEANDVAEESSENADESASGDESPFDDPVIPEI
jgi:hypothetical protein